MNSPHFPNNTPDRNILSQINLASLDNTEEGNQTEDLSKEIIKNEIKNLESSLSLYGYPSFSDILIPLSSNSQFSFSLKSTLVNLTKILRIKQKDNEIKVEYLDKINKLDTEKQNLENFVSKLKNGFNESTEKLKKSEQFFSEKNKKWKEKKQKFLADIEDVTKQLGKMRLRENQYNHEIKKKEMLITKLNEQLKKNILTTEKGSSTSKEYLTSSGIGNFSSSSQKSDMTVSYLLSKNFSSINYSNANLNSSSSSRNFFLDEIQKNLDNKYSNIIKENEKIKNFLLDIHQKFAQLVEIKKEVFLSYYKKTFGIDFPNDNNLDLNASMVFDSNFLNSTSDNKIFINMINLNPALEIEPFVDTFQANFIKLKEYLIKNEEMFYIENNFDQMESPGVLLSTQNKIKNSNRDNIFKFSNRNRENVLSEKYVQNMMSILENYKKLNRDLLIILNKMTKLKEIENESVINSIISRFENFNSLTSSNKTYEKSNAIEENEMNMNRMKYVDNIKEIVNENNFLLRNFVNEENLEKSEYVIGLENDYIRMQENERVSIEKYEKFNLNLLEDLTAYDKIINSTSDFCKN